MVEPIFKERNALEIETAHKMEIWLQRLLLFDYFCRSMCRTYANTFRCEIVRKYDVQDEVARDENNAFLLRKFADLTNRLTQHRVSRDSSCLGRLWMRVAKTCDL